MKIIKWFKQKFTHTEHTQTIISGCGSTNIQCGGSLVITENGKKKD